MAEKSVKVFLDSNVIISGLLSDKGAPRVILDLLCLGLPMLAGATGKYNIIEIERNLKKKMPDVLPIYKKYLPLLDLEVIPLPLSGAVRKLSGTIADKDVPVLASAISGNVDFLVTGDKKDFIKLKGKYPFRIVSNPAQNFWMLFFPRCSGFWRRDRSRDGSGEERRTKQCTKGKRLGIVSEDMNQNKILDKLHRISKIPKHKLGTIKLLRRILETKGIDEYAVSEIILPLEEIHFLRTKLVGHSSGEEANRIRKKIDCKAWRPQKTFSFSCRKHRQEH